MTHDPHTKASLAHRRLIGQLRAMAVPGAATVATALDACTEAEPCRSAVCPLCGFGFQSAAVSGVDQVIRVPARAILPEDVASAGRDADFAGGDDWLHTPHEDFYAYRDGHWSTPATDELGRRGNVLLWPRARAPPSHKPPR